MRSTSDSSTGAGRNGSVPYAEHVGAANEFDSEVEAASRVAMLSVDAVGVDEPLLRVAFAEVRRAKRLGEFGEDGVGWRNDRS